MIHAVERCICHSIRSQRIYSTNSQSMYSITVDSQKFRHPNYSALLRALIAVYSKVRQVSQIFQVKIPYFSAAHVMQQRHMTDYIPYSGLFSRGKIFANFTNRKQFVKILPSKCLLFNRYSLQSVTIRENFPLEKL